MTEPNKKLIAAVEAYFTEIHQVRASGGGTGERSYYPALEHLLGAVGNGLKPKVFCIQESAEQGNVLPGKSGPRAATSVG